MTKQDLEKFEKWIKQRGAEILPLTNPYEALRFKGREVGVIYTSGKVSGPYVREAIKAWKNDSHWKGAPIKMRRKSYRKEKEQLLERDGDKCFFCIHPLLDDITVEHLVPLSQGGKNSLGNMVLAHEQCNNEVGNMTVVEKVNIAILNRIKHKEKDEPENIGRKPSSRIAEIIQNIFSTDRWKRHKNVESKSSDRQT